MSSRPWRGGASMASSPTRSTWCLPHNRNTSSGFAGYFLSSFPCKRESIFVCERHLDPRVRGDDKRGGTVFETPSFPRKRESIFVFDSGTWIPAFEGMTNLADTVIPVP